jgi:hypothetical protein
MDEFTSVCREIYLMSFNTYYQLANHSMRALMNYLQSRLES